MPLACGQMPSLGQGGTEELPLLDGNAVDKAGAMKAGDVHLMEGAVGEKAA